MTRSQESRAAALWRITANVWPFLTLTPSKISGWLTTSKRPTGVEDIFAKISRNTGIQPRPATTQACLAMMVPEARRLGGMVNAVVMSLATLSSARAASRMVPTRLLFQSI